MLHSGLTQDYNEHGILSCLPFLLLDPSELEQGEKKMARKVTRVCFTDADVTWPPGPSVSPAPGAGLSVLLTMSNVALASAPAGTLLPQTALEGVAFQYG